MYGVLPTFFFLSVVIGSALNLSSLASKISLWRGDITRLEIDAIVNATRPSLLTGTASDSTLIRALGVHVDAAIHLAAGLSLLDECVKLNGCDKGDTKLTHGHRLPAKCE